MIHSILLLYKPPIPLLGTKLSRFQRNVNKPHFCLIRKLFFGAHLFQENLVCYTFDVMKVIKIYIQFITWNLLDSEREPYS